MRPKRTPCSNHRNHKQKKPEVAEPDMNFLVVCHARLPGIPALHVFFGGDHASKSNRYFQLKEGSEPAGMAQFEKRIRIRARFVSGQDSCQGKIRVRARFVSGHRFSDADNHLGDKRL
jgi:hypothetical protein